MLQCMCNFFQSSSFLTFETMNYKENHIPLKYDEV